MEKKNRAEDLREVVTKGIKADLRGELSMFKLRLANILCESLIAQNLSEQETQVLNSVKIPWRKWQPPVALLSWESHGAEAQAGCVHGSQESTLIRELLTPFTSSNPITWEVRQMLVKGLQVFSRGNGAWYGLRSQLEKCKQTKIVSLGIVGRRKE